MALSLLPKQQTATTTTTRETRGPEDGGGEAEKRTFRHFNQTWSVVGAAWTLIPPRIRGTRVFGGWVPGSPGFSQFVGSLSNSMHVLMKHCWPAAHCQSHCCLDDWSIEGLRAFVPTPPSNPSSSLSLFLCLSFSLSRSFSPPPQPESSSTSARFESTASRSARDQGRRRPYIGVFGERPKQRPRTSTLASFSGVQPVAPVTYLSHQSLGLATKALPVTFVLKLVRDPRLLSIVSASDLSRDEAGLCSRFGSESKCCCEIC